MIAAIISRLKAEVSTLKTVEGAAGFQKASESNPTATPAAFVFLVNESADDLECIDEPIVQHVSVTLSVVLVVRHVGDSRGAAAGIDMETLRQAVLQALYGYRANAAQEPLARHQSTLIAFRDGHMWWQETFVTGYFATGA